MGHDADAVATKLQPEAAFDPDISAIDFSQLLEQSPARICLWDQHLICRYANSAYASFFGLTRQQIVGRSVADLLGPEKFAATLPRFKAALAGEPQSYEREKRLPDGSVRYEMVHYESDARGGSHRGLLVYITDITERKRIEQGAASGADQYRALYTRTPAALHSIDRDGRLLSVSDEWLRLLGYSREDVIGRPSTDFLTADSKRRACEINLPSFWDNGTAHDVPYQMLTKDGRIVDVLMSAVTERSAESRPERGLTVVVDITERKRVERALYEQKLLLDHAERLAGVGAWSYDPTDGTGYWSDNLCRMLEVPINFRPAFEEGIPFFAPDWREAVRAATTKVVATGISVDMEVQMLTASGRALWVNMTAAPEIEHGPVTRVFGAIQDISARKEVERSLASKNALLQTTLDSIGDAVITTNIDGVIEWLNPVASALTGYALNEARQRPIADIFHVVQEDSRVPVASPVERARANHAQVGPAPLLLIARNGEERAIIDSAAPIRDEEGRILGYVMVFHDVTEQRRLSREVSHRASHDSLTGLMNRAEFERRLQRAFDQTRMHAVHHVLLYIDLDQFKIVNDTCGHAAGDLLLRTTATLFGAYVRTSDILARLGGDEFGVLLENCTVAQARRVAEQLCEQMDRYRFVHGEERFRVGASIGMVPVSQQWSSEAEILQAADSACYAAKEAGRNRVHEWRQSDARMLARQHEMHWASQIESGLDENRFRLYGQKMVGCASAIPGLHLEVLLRLSMSEGEIVNPAAFFPAAERFHLASRIDRWVLAKVISLLSHRDYQAIDTIAINLSGQSIGDRSFHRYALELIQGADVDPRKLCFEITETAAITYMGDAGDFINTMRTLGVRVALDDFGSGISSFGYLKALPVDFLKIDRIFVQRILEERLDHVAVSSFCEAANVCGLKTIAEGVETAEVLEALRDIGVDIAQGYLFHQPEPLEALISALSL